MSLDPQPISPMFRIDVSPDPQSAGDPSTAAVASGSASAQGVMIDLLKQLVIGQQKQNRMLETLAAAQENVGSRADDLSAWKDANPDLADKCRGAAETLSQVQSQFLESLVDEINDNGDYLVEGDYMMNEFIDRFGPRMAHLNGVLQVLAQLSSEPADTL